MIDKPATPKVLYPITSELTDSITICRGDVPLLIIEQKGDEVILHPRPSPPIPIRWNDPTLLSVIESTNPDYTSITEKNLDELTIELYYRCPFCNHRTLGRPKTLHTLIPCTFCGRLQRLRNWTGRFGPANQYPYSAVLPAFTRDWLNLDGWSEVEPAIFTKHEGPIIIILNTLNGTVHSEFFKSHQPPKTKPHEQERIEKLLLPYYHRLSAREINESRLIEKRILESYAWKWRNESKNTSRENTIATIDKFKKSLYGEGED